MGFYLKQEASFAPISFEVQQNANWNMKSFQKNSSGILITESYLAMILRISNWSSPFFIKVLCKTESELLWQIDVGPAERGA